MTVDLRLGDCLDVMAGMEPNSVDSIITDPPYGLEFMGKDWDCIGKGWNDKTEATKTGQDKGDFSWFGGNKRPRYGTDGRAMQDFHHAWAVAALRVAKPGAILMAFGGTRTFHRLACAIEDAGWEIRDTMMWVYGSGFPKSHNLDGDFDGWGTALKPAWEPIIIAMKPLDGTFAQNAEKWGVAGLWIAGSRVEALPLTGQRPCGTMTAGKGGPSWEQEKSLCDSCAALAGGIGKPTIPAIMGCSVQSNAEPTLSERGTTSPADMNRRGTGCSDGMTTESTDGSLSIGESGEKLTDPCQSAMFSTTSTETRKTTGLPTCALCRVPLTSANTQRSMPQMQNGGQNTPVAPGSAAPLGRWPSNLIHDGSDEVVAGFPQVNGPWGGNGSKSKCGATSMFGIGDNPDNERYKGSGSAARFFYCAKSSRAEREAGCEGMEDVGNATLINQTRPVCNTCGCGTIIAGPGKRMACGHTDIRFEPSVNGKDGKPRKVMNGHPTVKPLALMRYLCRLTKTPAGGVVLDPFMGSGTTGCAAIMEGREFIGIEKEPEYMAIAEKRIAHAQLQPALVTV